TLEQFNRPGDSAWADYALAGALLHLRPEDLSRAETDLRLGDAPGRRPPCALRAGPSGVWGGDRGAGAARRDAGPDGGHPAGAGLALCAADHPGVGRWRLRRLRHRLFVRRMGYADPERPQPLQPGGLRPSSPAGAYS